jgi:hypothetical protein
MGETDNRLEQLMHTVNLQYTGTGEPTHQKGTEIDHVLVSMRSASSTSKAKVAPGVSGKDHKLVWVDHHFEIDSEGCGPARVIGPRLDKVKEKTWEKYCKAARSWAEIELVSQAYQNMSTHDKARHLQQYMMAAAADAIEDDKGQHVSDVEEGDGMGYAQKWDNMYDTTGKREGETKRRILHLFSGPPERADGLAAHARARGIEVDEVDILVDPVRGDILREDVYASIMRRVRGGEYIGAVIGTPCTTFSVNRLRADGETDKGASQVRARVPGTTQHRGMDGLLECERREVERANEMIQFNSIQF